MARALITGASSGIGMEFAHLLAAENKDLIITARRTDRLEQLKTELTQQHSIQVDIIPADLSQPTGPTELYKQIKQRSLQVNLLINNAGFGVYQAFTKADHQRLTEMVQVNVTALTELAHLCAQDMKQLGKGAILNVASMVGLRPLPYYAVYAATKAYVVSLGDALHAELKDDNITVTTLSPGLTQTEFFEVSGYPRSRSTDYFTLPARKVAQIGLKALAKGKAHVVPGSLNNVGAWFLRWIPVSWTRQLVAKRIRQHMAALKQ